VWFLIASRDTIYRTLEIKAKAGWVMNKDGSIHPRTSRVHFAVSILVSGHSESGSPFQEDTRTVTINANGGLIEMETPVVKGQILSVTNMATRKDISVLVVTIGNIVNGKPQVGVSFNQSAPRFWGLSFPPDDWDPADRKRPAPARRERSG